MKYLLLNQNIIFLFLCIVITSKEGLSQGTWNLEYFDISSLNNNYIGQQIRIDFRSEKSDTLTTDIVIRKLLAKKSKIFLDIGDSKVEFQENWILYPDHGNLHDQFLASSNSENKDSIVIQEIFLDSVFSDSIIINANLLYPETDKSFLREIAIDKKIIKGILVVR